MSILIFAAVIVIIALLLCYLVDLAQAPAPMNPILKVLIIVVAIVLIAHKAGIA